MRSTIRREVLGDEFERAYYGVSGDPASEAEARDNRHIITNVLKDYRSQLSEDELKTCGMMALWRCLSYHRAEFGQKLTTSLHRFVRWECDREINRRTGKRKKHRPKVVALPDVSEEAGRQHRGREPMPDMQEDLDHVMYYLEMLPEEQKAVVRQYYVDGLTMSEIGRVNGYSKETARIRVTKSVEALRQICLASLGEAA